MSNEGVTIEEIPDGESDHVEEVSNAPEGSAAVPAPRIGLNRNEKKARKALSKIGLKPVPGVRRIVVKRNGVSVLFVVNKPEVYSNPGNDTFVIYGVASTLGEEQAGLAQAAAQLGPETMAKLKSMAEAAGNAEASGSAGETAAAADSTPADAAEDEEVDETGLDANDIDMMISQANCSRAKAVKALRANNGDVVDAIMELTMS